MSNTVSPYNTAQTSDHPVEQGAIVTAHYRNSNASLLPLTEKYDTARLRLAAADLTSEPAVIALFAGLPAPAEVLVVNHAVYSGSAAIKDMSLARWVSTLDNNLTSSFLVVREYLRGLERGVAVKKGRETKFGDRAAVVLVGSTAGKYGEDHNADYAASKSGTCPPAHHNVMICEYKW